VSNNLLHNSRTSSTTKILSAVPESLHEDGQTWLIFTTLRCEREKSGKVSNRGSHTARYINKSVQTLQSRDTREMGSSSTLLSLGEGRGKSPFGAAGLIYTAEVSSYHEVITSDSNHCERTITKQRPAVLPTLNRVPTGTLWNRSTFANVKK
jgi:hypothetical protein